MARYDLLLESPNYQDFATTGIKDIDIYTDGAGTYSYDPDTQTFSAGGGTYGKSSVPIPVYETGDAYESYFDTVNIIFNTEEVKDKNVEAFVTSAVSMARLEITYSSGGNYTFQNKVREVRQGNERETAFFSNDTIRYRGSKPIVVHNIYTKSRTANSIKFRVKAKMDVEDDMSIFYITILPAGLVFSGESDA